MAVQTLPRRIVMPKGFSRQYTCVASYIDGYTMDHLANLIWVGGIIAAAGPPGFKALRRDLQPALQHYIFGHGADEAAMRKAHGHVRSFCCTLEKLVIQKQVCMPQA